MRKLETIETKISNCADPKKTKVTIELNDHEASSVKSIAVKQQSRVQPTGRFKTGKLLMFIKLFLKS